MIKKVKLISFVLSASIAFTLAFSACSQQAKPVEEKAGTTAAQQATEATKEETKEAKKVTLKFWAGIPEDKGPNQMVEAFNKLDPNIQVEYTRYTNDEAGNTKLDVTLASGEEIDLFQSYNTDTLTKRINGQNTLDLTELIAKNGYDLQKALGESGLALVKKGSGNDKIYYLPTSFYFDYVMLNKNMVDKAGLTVPEAWTYDEFRDFVKKLTAADVKGLAAPWDWGSTMISQFAEYSVDMNGWLNSDNTVAYLDNPAYKKTLATFVDMMHIDQSAQTYSDTITKKLSYFDEFLKGKAAVIIPGGDWLFRYIKDKEKYPHDFITTFAPVPTVEKGTVPFYRDSLSDMTSINAKSKNQEEAFKFLTWYLDSGISYLVPFGRLPASHNVDLAQTVDQMFGQDGAALFDTESYKKLLGAAQKSKIVADDFNAKRPVVNKILAEEYEKALMKAKSVDDALKAIKERADAELKKN